MKQLLNGTSEVFASIPHLPYQYFFYAKSDIPEGLTSANRDTRVNF